MIGKHLLICVIFLTIARTINGEYDVNGFCTLVKDGTRLGSIDSCQAYYLCQGGRAIPQSCSSNQAFDKDAGSCRPASDVSCNLGGVNPCSGQNNIHVPLDGTCGGWVYCQNNVETGRGQCTSGQVFINGACTYGNCQDNAYSPSAGFKTACSVVPNNVYFGSNLDCARWQICKGGKLSTGDCGTNMAFDVQMGKCNFYSDALCTRVNGKDIQPDGDGECTLAEQGVQKASGSVCSNYLVCTNGNWVRYKCQIGLFYDMVQDKCISRRSARTSPTCNRCEGSKKQFVNAVDPDCRKYLTCQNSLKTGMSSCIDPSYFNEELQACVKDAVSSKVSYQDRNGACFTSAFVIEPVVDAPIEEDDGNTNGDTDTSDEGNNDTPDEDGETK